MSNIKQCRNHCRRKLKVFYALLRQRRVKRCLRFFAIAKTDDYPVNIPGCDKNDDFCRYIISHLEDYVQCISKKFKKIIFIHKTTPYRKP